MRLKKKDFIGVCKKCMNGIRDISKCPSTTCPLASVKDGKDFRANVGLLKRMCKACDPEGYSAGELCETRDGCPLAKFYNEYRAERSVRGVRARGSDKKLS